MSRLGLSTAGIFISVLVFGAMGTTLAAAPDMTFFVTSVGKGDGANLGGLEGADAHCAALAKAAGSTHTN